MILLTVVAIDTGQVGRAVTVVVLSDKCWRYYCRDNRSARTQGNGYQRILG